MRRLCAILAILCPACGLFAAYDMRNQPTAALDGWKTEAEPARPDAVCRSGETVEFRVRLLKDGRPAPGRKLVWSIHGDYARGAKGECVSAAEPVTLRFTPRGPGFTWLKVDCPLEAGRKIYARAGVMTDPETVRPGFAEPADFDAFWEEQKRAVRAGAMAPREVPLEVEEPYRGRFELFDVTVATPGTKPVRAYLTRLAGEPGRKFPAMVTWHAAGVRSAMPQYRFAGMGLLVLDVNAHGIGNGGSHEEYVRLYRTTMKDYRFEGADDREKIYFNGMYRRLIRALDYLKSRPDWDGRTLIVYGGSQAFYRTDTDEVHLPERADFKSMQEFYSTALHEIGHSTGHESRLNRDLSGRFGSEGYAMEELRAEIASIFMEQDLEIEPSEGRLQNNVAYIQSWKEEIKENPNALFTAITDADKIAKYVSERERAYRRVNDVQYYAIIEETNAYSEQVYKCCICDEEGEVKPLINYAFADREALEKEIDKVKELDLWKDKTFEEVSIEELKEKGKAGKVEQEKSTEYIKPSELVATEVAAKALPVSMKGRGSESLARMSDRETLARAEGYYAKDSKFADLYVGKNVMKNIERSESGLMLRLAMFCGNDEEQLLRIFKSSGQFRDEKPNAYYMKLASESMKTIREMRGSIAAAQENNGFTKGKTGINSKR